VIETSTGSLNIDNCDFDTTDAKYLIVSDTTDVDIANSDITSSTISEKMIVAEAGDLDLDTVNFNNPNTAKTFIDQIGTTTSLQTVTFD